MATQRKSSAQRKSASKRKSAAKRKARGKRAAEPWDRPAPPKAKHTKLTPAKKAAAKRSAKRAGRHYPNLVDNMRQASKSR